MCTGMNDSLGIGRSLANLGVIAYLQEDYESGRHYLEESLSIFETLGQDSDRVDTFLRLVDLHLKQNHLMQAQELAQVCLQLSRRLGDKLSIAFSLGSIGEIYRLQGNFDQANQYFTQALQIHWEMHHIIDLPYTLEAMAMSLTGMGSTQGAARLIGAANQLRTKHNSPLPPSYEKMHAQNTSRIINSLGEIEFHKYFEEGQCGSLEQIIHLAVGSL